ncbi:MULTISPECIES: hypothetical protein, partial [unclassified Dehalobacter]|uniref:hypothetical protein n=1 Tax=unclassified Dehalobacter TaxID=2635733 RepID=UPI0010ECAD24
KIRRCQVMKDRASIMVLCFLCTEGVQLGCYPVLADAKKGGELNDKYPCEKRIWKIFVSVINEKI